MRSIGNVERNAALSDAAPLTADQRATIAKHAWDRNFYEAA
jgi:hypothetical protein